MKGIKVTLIVILSGLVVILGLALAVGLNGGFPGVSFFNYDSDHGSFFSWDTRGNCTLQNTTTIEPKDLTGLKINYNKTSFDIIFLPTEEDTITLKEYFNKDVDANKMAKIEQKGNLLKITQQVNQTMKWNHNKIYGYIEILVPEKVYCLLKSIEASTTSGDINLPELADEEAMETSFMEGFYLSTVSGDINADYIKSEETSIISTSGYINLGYHKGDTLSVSTTSGDITVSELQCNISNIISTSGDINVSKAECGENTFSSTSGDIFADAVNGDLEINSTSGNLNIGTIKGNLNTNGTSGDQEVKAITGYLNMNSTSGYLTVYELTGDGIFSTVNGDIKVDVKQRMENIEIGTTSGEVYVTLPKDSSFIFNANSTNGTISTFFDEYLSFNKRQTSANGTIGTQAENKIDINTTSGDITIRH